MRGGMDLWVWSTRSLFCQKGNACQYNGEAGLFILYTSNINEKIIKSKVDGHGYKKITYLTWLYSIKYTKSEN